MEGMPAEGTGLPSVGAVIAGKYRVDGVLGQGGMGTVFAARNQLTGKRVAIKWLLPEHAGSTTRDRLLREAQIASSIDHPNVVDIYDVGEHDGGLFLVMEYLRGKPLSDVLAEMGRLEPEHLITLLVPAMRGVHAAHQAGVIHRDLKPENIFLSEQDGQIVPKVLDFGVSKMVGADLPASSLTRTGALVGTPHYMSLEQVDGSNAIDARTDVYAFGVLLYRALTGHLPFDGSTLGEVILKIGTKDPAPLRMSRPELPAALDALVLRAMSRDRSKRFRDLEELARALLPFAGARIGDRIDASWLPGSVRYDGHSTAGSQGGALLASRASSLMETRTRRKRALLGAVAAVIAICGIGTWFAMRQPQSAPIVSRAVMAPALPAALEPPPAVAPPALAVEPALAPEPVFVETPDMDVVPTAAELAPEKSSHTDKRARRDEARSQPKPAVKSVAPDVIPGARTNGLSFDDF